MAAESELLYVNSKIIEPSKLSPEQFTSWYNDVHIPDIFQTSGIKQAFRYITAESDSTAVERPYLALYPVKFKEYFTSKEFYSIPVTSDTLPGPTHNCFDVANFDTRYYTFVSSVGEECFQVPYVLTVQIESSEQIESDVAKLFQQKLGTNLSMRAFKCHFLRENRLSPEEKKLGAPPSDLAVLWFSTEEQLNTVAAKAQKFGKVAKFKLLRAFAASA